MPDFPAVSAKLLDFFVKWFDFIFQLFFIMENGKVLAKKFLRAFIAVHFVPGIVGKGENTVQVGNCHAF
ncbi:MAG: hypothetical protein C5S49_05230 [Candidatus Methanogaster sp.]|nr:MAG: hypothetical protein C5S49_05230 [ANME-2 cluster archaeon]